MVEPGRTIIKMVTVAHSRLKTPVSMARRAADWVPRLEAGACAAASALSWPGRINRARMAAAAAVRRIEAISQPLTRTPRLLAVAGPKTGTAMLGDGLFPGELVAVESEVGERDFFSRPVGGPGQCPVITSEVNHSLDFPDRGGDGQVPGAFGGHGAVLPAVRCG